MYITKIFQFDIHPPVPNIHCVHEWAALYLLKQIASIAARVAKVSAANPWHRENTLHSTSPMSSLALDMNHACIIKNNYSLHILTRSKEFHRCIECERNVTMPYMAGNYPVKLPAVLKRYVTLPNVCVDIIWQISFCNQNVQTDVGFTSNSISAKSNGTV